VENLLEPYPLDHLYPLVENFFRDRAFFFLYSMTLYTLKKRKKRIMVFPLSLLSSSLYIKKKEKRFGLVYLL
jgi:hypothetical protein